ncbi:unnamed protein product [Spodoptera littoralis]|uniref:CRAL-TRIO domain-containing protein n=1 Tax=Spodoptera littoralis TaxID=7109 RepID=A0A9P0N1B2_SPOLI|nr:unnamed protein product [Spodoptera littoralis]CAH1640962.1 unnamed protein product [Spodoptera littoralis]
MVTVLKDKLLEFHPDTLEHVRMELNLDKNGRMDDAVNLLEEWVKKQQHFVKKDFSRAYLERTLISAKGMVERAKQRIDKLCTFKTLLPEYYPKSVAKGHFDSLEPIVQYGLLPKLTKDHYRVSLFNVKSDDYNSGHIHLFYKYIVMICEYIKINDYNNGFVVALDFRDANILTFVTKCTPMDLRQVITLMTEGYGIRIKQIHLITESKMLDTLVSFLKQVLSTKLAGRIHMHKNLDTLYDFVPKDVLPVEYGGPAKSLQIISDEWRDALTSKDFMEYFAEMYEAKTDEACRQSDKFTEQYIGMPGSFRALSVD